MPTRARQIELLVDKSENLNQQAFRFKKQSVALKRAMYCTHLKITLMVAFAVIVRAPPPWPILSVCAFNRHRPADGGLLHRAGHLWHGLQALRSEAPSLGSTCAAAGPQLGVCAHESRRVSGCSASGLIVPANLLC